MVVGPHHISPHALRHTHVERRDGLGDQIERAFMKPQLAQRLHDVIAREITQALIHQHGVVVLTEKARAMQIHLGHARARRQVDGCRKTRIFRRVCRNNKNEGL